MIVREVSFVFGVFGVSAAGGMCGSVYLMLGWLFDCAPHECLGFLGFSVDSVSCYWLLCGTPTLGKTIKRRAVLFRLGMHFCRRMVRSLLSLEQATCFGVVFLAVDDDDV